MDESLCCIFLYAFAPKNLCHDKQRISPAINSDLFSKKVLDFRNLLCYVVVLIGAVINENAIKGLWHKNVIPQEDSRTNSLEMK